MPSRLYLHMLWYVIYHYRHLIGYLFLTSAIIFALAQIKSVQDQDTYRSKANLVLVTDLSNVVCEARKLSVDTPYVAHARKDLIHVSLKGIPTNGARALQDLQIVVARGPVAKQSMIAPKTLVDAETKLINDLARQGLRTCK